MPSEWREIFDATFVRKCRDEVWKLLPDSLVCEANFDPLTNELSVKFYRRELPIAVVLAPLLPARKVRGFSFVMPPIDSWEAREWMDQADRMLGSVVASIKEHLPALLADFEDAPCNN